MVAQGDVQQSAYDPWALQSAIGLTDARLALDSVLMPRPNLTYLDYRSGVMASGDDGGNGHMAMKVSPGSGWVVTVEMGNCVINTPSQGAYMCALDSQKPLTLNSASSTANRIDLIVARVYDDLNSAIGSPAGTRKFTVEVLTGDNATGTPAQPTPSYAGYTLLAAVYIGKGSSSITAANITDLRGPGLAARGGMRGLYGADAAFTSSAFLEPGAFPGEQRWVHNAGFQHQVYYGGTEGWRGVFNGLRYTTVPAAGETLWTKGVGTRREICRLTVPDPGVPYMVYPTMRAVLTLSYNTSVDLVISLDSATGATVNWDRDDTFGRSWDSVKIMNVVPHMYGPLTGSHDVVVSAVIHETPGSDFGFAYRGNDGSQNWLEVNVFPSSIQPGS